MDSCCHFLLSYLWISVRYHNNIVNILSYILLEGLEVEKKSFRSLEEEMLSSLAEVEKD